MMSAGSRTLVDLAVVFGTSGAFACLLTYLVFRYATVHAILDYPNTRSLHARPVPRGGGLAIVVTMLLSAVCLAAMGAVPWPLVIALAGGGGAVAAIGWLDDRRGVTAGKRVAVQMAAALWALAWLGGLEQVRIGSATLEFGVVIGSLLAAIGIVWWTNLFNFMDGIDGIAAGQAATVSAFAAVLTVISADAGATALLAAALAGAAAGFLVWNWAPARIFMGDVGSGFLGFVFAVLAIAAERSAALPLMVWLMLSGVFLFDSTVTLVRRTINGERWTTAHRKHAYQRLVTTGRSHWFVTACALILNAILALIMYLSLSRQIGWLAGAAAAIILLTVVYLVVEKANPMERTTSAPPNSPVVGR